MLVCWCVSGVPVCWCWSVLVLVIVFVFVGELVRRGWGFAGDIEETDSAGEGKGSATFLTLSPGLDVDEVRGQQLQR